MSLDSAAHDPEFDKRYQRAIQRARVFSDRLSGPSLAERLARLPVADRARILDSVAPSKLALLRYDWAWRSRPKQDPDLSNTPHRILFLLGGRGAGKTISGANRIRRRVEAGARSIAIVGPTLRDIERYQITGEGGGDGILTVFPPKKRPEYKAHKAIVFFHRNECSGCTSAEHCGGAIAYVNSAEEPEFRGPNLDTVWCLVGETRVKMANGRTKRIDNVRSGDMVATRSGPRRVTWSGVTQRNASLWRLEASNGAELIGTANHKIFADGRFVNMSDTPKGAELTTWSTQQNSTAKGSGSSATISATRPVNSCTALSGNITTARSQPGTSCITGTATSVTTGSQTSNSSPTLRTVASMAPSASQCGRAKKDRSPSVNSGSDANPLNERAGVAARATGRPAPTAIGAVKSAASPRAITMSKSESLARRADVYDITVEGEHEFFANGILVHNCDEPAKWRYLSTIWNNIELATRLRGPLSLEIMLTGTPLPLQLFRELIADDETVTILMSQEENASNLDPAYLARMRRKYGGTRLGRQELDGEILTDNPDALFQATVIDATRVEFAPVLEEVAVSVDPAIATNPENDETGIIAGGRGADGHIYILLDLSGRSKAEKWGDDVIKACTQLQCDTVIGERNRGGDLVAANVRAAKERKSGAMAAKALKIVEVLATRGKAIRAEPVSALSDRGMIHIVGRMPELEGELTEWNPRIGGVSPNRLDALVWLVWHLARLGEEEKPDYHAGFRGLTAATQRLASSQTASTVTGLIGSLPRAPWGSRL